MSTKTQSVPDLPGATANMKGRLTGVQTPPAPETEAKQEDTAPRPDNRKQEKSERKQKPEWTTTWLAQDPRTWVGKKVRMKKNGNTYTIRTVYKNDRVELEKSWMTYSSDVATIRADYETCI